MAIGGKFYQANQAAQEKYHRYGSQINRNRIENNRSSALTLSSSLFTINSTAFSDQTSYTLQSAVQRIEAAVKAQNEQLQKKIGSLGLFA
jgi:hypothetical protein